MAGVEQPRLKLLYVLKLLEEESDEENGVTMSRILAYLEQHGVSAERKSIYRDLATLQEFGYEIEKNGARPVEYCLNTRTFALAELKLLVDAVQSAQFISKEMTDKLIRKLASQTSRSRASDLRRQVHYAGRVKSDNDHVYYTTGTLHDAINHNRRVTFKYIEHTLDRGTQPRRDGEPYEISPYALVWNDDRYYVVGHYERYGKVCNFRVDRMKSVTPLKTQNHPEPGDFRLENYIKNEFSLFTGETVSLDVLFDNSLINPVMDRFGVSTTILPHGPNHFIAHIQAAVSPVFYSWLFQFGSSATILTPERIAKEYRERVKEVLAGMV
jgi:predicted DNA-binding transcriptional regulator YafY